MNVAIIDASGFTLPYDHCLAKALAQEGCRVVLATTRLPPGPWTDSAPYERWEHFYRVTNKLSKGRIRVYLKGCEHLLDMGRLVHRLRDWKPDVIHFQWLPLAVVDGLYLCRLRRIAPLVLTIHDTEPFHGAPSSRLQILGLEKAYRRFDYYIVHTHQSREVIIERLGLPMDRIKVIPHGVFSYYRDFVRFSETPPSFNKIPGELKILFFGVLKPYKGVDVLLEAFAYMPEPLRQKTVLQVVGAPRMPVKPLQELTRRLGIEKHVSWDLRFVEEREVASYFSQADVVVLPYRRIDQSGVLMVALAFGKPVVASRLGGFAETIVDGVHGFLVEPGDAESLAQALTRVLGDRELRKQLGSAVERLAGQELSWNNIAQQTVHLYREVLRAGRR